MRGVVASGRGGAGGLDGGVDHPGGGAVSVPLGSPAFVAAAVAERVGGQRRLTDAIAALPPSALQTQLLLLRLCAGPRANYWLRALPLEAGAQLAGAVDRDAVAVLLRLLTDGADTATTRTRLAARAALPPARGGLGIGGRALMVVPRRWRPG